VKVGSRRDWGEPLLNYAICLVKRLIIAMILFKSEAELLLLILELLAEQHLVEVVRTLRGNRVEDEVRVLLVLFRFVLHVLPFFI
jgi:hypothetical protein